MFEEGFIIYFTPFYFKNGNTPKNKYCIILKHTKDESIYLLTTRSNKIPKHLMNDDYCISDDEINFSCFAFPINLEVTDCGKRFDFKTYCYTDSIDSFAINVMSEKYPTEDKDF